MEIKKIAIECDGKSSNYTEAETIINLKETRGFGTFVVGIYKS